LLQDPAEKCSKCGADTSNPKSPFIDYRFNDTRHQAVTELAESKAKPPNNHGNRGPRLEEDAAAHSHIRLDAARQALDAITLKPELNGNAGDTTKGYDTNTDTNRSGEIKGVPQVVDFLGGAERDRTAGLLVANEALSQLSYSPTTFPFYQREGNRESPVLKVACTF
jgi:hypothetical protein